MSVAMRAGGATRKGLGALIGGAIALALTSAAASQVPEALPPDVAFGRYIAIVRADLSTGDELVQKRAWALAYRHFMFPLEEVYGVIRDDLRSYKTPPFDYALRTLARTVKAQNVRQYPKALEKVEAALAAADVVLKARQPAWSSFVVRVAIATLKTVPEEYEDAVVDGRIARPISYQVARSFILQSERMIESVAAELSAKNPEALRDIRDRFAELKQDFAGVNAPKQAPLDVAAVTDRVEKIAAAAGRL